MTGAVVIGMSFMTKYNLLLFFIFIVNFIPSLVISDESQKEKVLKIYSYEVKSSEVLSLSIEAINRCFDNISRGIKTDNFPDNPGPMNLPFPISKDYNYDRIVGYEFAESNPTVVTFLIGADGILGHHIAVVINITKMDVIKVYNRPGS